MDQHVINVVGQITRAANYGPLPDELQPHEGMPDSAPRLQRPRRRQRQLAASPPRDRPHRRRGLATRRSNPATPLRRRTRAPVAAPTTHHHAAPTPQPASSPPPTRTWQATDSNDRRSTGVHRGGDHAPGHDARWARDPARSTESSRRLRHAVAMALRTIETWVRYRPSPFDDPALNPAIGASSIATPTAPPWRPHSGAP